LTTALEAIFYVLKSGCAWRLLPHDLPRWKTVYHYFRSWCLDGTWERMHAALSQRVRVRLKRNPQPSAAIADSQSIKTTGRGRAATWLRRRQEGQRSQAAPVGRHAGVGARSPSPQRTDPRPRRHQALAEYRRAIACPSASLACGWTPDTPEKSRVRAGCRRYWDGRPRSSC
jgi:transposase